MSNVFQFLGSVEHVFVGDINAVPEARQSLIADINFSRSVANPAVDAAQANPDVLTAYYIAPGSYNLNAGPNSRLTVDKSMAFIGLGESPDDVVFTRGDGINHRNAIRPTGSHWEAVFHNIRIASTNSPADNLVIFNFVPNTTLRFDRCALYKRNSDGVFARGTSVLPDTFNLFIDHCELDSTVALTRGFNGGGFLGESIHITNTLIPTNTSFNEVTGDLAVSDFVTSPATGYGWEYSPYPDVEHYFSTIGSKVIDLAGTPTRVVVFIKDSPGNFGVRSVDADGQWEASIIGGWPDFFIYYLSQDARNPPIIHGPYTATED